MRAARATAAVAAVVVTAVAALAGGCGRPAEPPSTREPVRLAVTRDFGTTVIARAALAPAMTRRTALSVLRERLAVGLTVTGVESIGGVHARAGLRWRLYVNGIATARPETPVHGGDAVWWDLHPGDAEIGSRAAVGSFPQPFRSGRGGRRLPVVVACSADAGVPCDEAVRRLRAAGIEVSRSAPGSTAGLYTMRVLVGPWRAVRRDGTAALVEHGPGVSGVPVTFADGGSTLVALDEAGRPARRLGPGTGLVAAIAPPGQSPAWLVTGTDGRGALAAARALSPRALADRFAVAVQGGTSISLPVARATRARR